MAPSLYFATDLHGSDICWRKFLNAAAFYRVDVLVCGGDITGKAMVPIVERPGGFEVWNRIGDPLALETAEAHALSVNTRRSSGHRTVLVDRADVVANAIRRMGCYPIHVTPDQLDELVANPDLLAATFRRQIVQTLERWMDIAERKLRGTGIRCVAVAGNDDMPEIDEVLAQCGAIEVGEGRVINLDGFELLSTGWVNPTPWNTYREEAEGMLRHRIDAMVRRVHDPTRAIFNFHAPPLHSGLDEAPALDADLTVRYGGAAIRPVGSIAVQEVIQAVRPLLSLHGHVHEAWGARKLGRTLAINPGSSYDDGLLRGAVIRLDVQKGIKSYQLMTG
jgi:uncharacterized protein